MAIKTDYRLMQAKSIDKLSILQYFWPSLSYQVSLRPFLVVVLHRFYCIKN